VVDGLSLQYLFYPTSFMLPLMRWVQEADVVQVFNTHGGYFNHLALAPLSRARPVIWRLSDMWALTGHCAYSYECERWQTGCGACPHLDEYPRLNRDTSALLWRMKKWIYARSRLTIVTPSVWLASLARRSPLLNRFPIHVIPNGLDTEVFRPSPRSLVRQRLGLDPDGHVVMFSAASILLERKGAAYLKEALLQLSSDIKKKLTLLVVGREADGWQMDGPFRIKTLGHLNDDEALAAAYSASDVFVLPTLAENLPNGILESMACGTPVVSFDVGGVSDAVRHMETGYLAGYRDVADLAKGIQLLLDDAPLRTRMSGQCRVAVKREYSLALQTRRFLDLYNDAIAQHRSRPLAAKA
jgi:glycosyltransferase involved in cell wall biosynthesis